MSVAATIMHRLKANQRKSLTDDLQA